MRLTDIKGADIEWARIEIMSTYCSYQHFSVFDGRIWAVRLHLALDTFEMWLPRKRISIEVAGVPWSIPDLA